MIKKNKKLTLCFLLALGLILPFSSGIVAQTSNQPPVLSAVWTIANFEIGVRSIPFFNRDSALEKVTAFDFEDGDITDKIVALDFEKVDLNTPGTYLVTLTVTDSGGLTAKLVKEINVRAQGAKTPGRCFEQDDLSDVYTKECNINQPPVITLIGDNPMTVWLNDAFSDPGATANDPEQGDLTSQINISGFVNTFVVGSYVLTYSVKDSAGLEDIASRVVIVVKKSPLPKITVCKIVSDEQWLFDKQSPSDIFILPGPQRPLFVNNDHISSLATTTFVTPLSLNFDLLGNDGINDAQCVIYDNLPYSHYFFDREIVNSEKWLEPLYFIALGGEVISQDKFALFNDKWYTADTSDDIYVSRSAGLVDMYPANIQTPGAFDQTVVVWNRYKTEKPQNRPPVITLIGDNPMIVLLNATFTDPGATASDPEEGNITSRIVRTGAVNTSATGIYPLFYSVSDTPGLTATTSRIVKVVANPPANQKPVITVLGDNPLTITVGSTFSDPGATAFDPEDGNITANIVKGGSVNASLEGTYTITYNVVDYKGLAADQKTRTVKVIPSVPPVVPPPTCSNCYPPAIPPVYPPANQPPVITLIGADPITVLLNATFTDPGATASDKEDGDITAKIVKSGSVDTTKLGNYNLIYKVTDSGGLSAAITRTVKVEKPNEPTPEPQVCNYLLEYLKIDKANNPLEVIKLQTFLKNYEGFSNLQVNGVFDQATDSAVRLFQLKYKDDVLTPWSLTAPTGYVYITTKKKINEIYCQKPFPLTSDQEQEIADYKKWLEDLAKASVVVPQTNKQIEVKLPDVGVNTKPEEAEKEATTDNGSKLVVLEEEETTQTTTSDVHINEQGIATIEKNVECPVCQAPSTATNLTVAGLNGLVGISNGLLLLIVQIVLLGLLAAALILALRSKQTQTASDEGRIVFTG